MALPQAHHQTQEDKYMKIEKLIKELRKFETDLKEVTIGGDLDFQTKRLTTLLDEFDPPSKPIHGGGTGRK